MDDRNVVGVYAYKDRRFRCIIYMDARLKMQRERKTTVNAMYMNKEKQDEIHRAIDEKLHVWHNCGGDQHRLVTS